MNGFPIYFDQDSGSARLATALRERDVDVMTASEVGLSDISDEQQLMWARSAGRVLYTANAGNFYAIHSRFVAEGLEHAGIIVRQQRLASRCGEYSELWRNSTRVK